jgi:hypothetical protein
MSDEWEPIMCYADTDTNDDGTVTAFCYCGWSDDFATQELADAAAEEHVNLPDDLDKYDDYDDAPATA